MTRPRGLVALAIAILVATMLPGSVAPAAAAAPTPASASAPDPAAKLRGDLAALVAGEASLDPRIPGLVPGLHAGELPYFVLMSAPNDGAHRAALEDAGARVLRTYRSIDLFAVASDPTTVLRIAALPWVDRLAPIEVVVALDDEHEVDQSRATTADVGATPWWDRGITGRGVRIAVLDTGLDPVHPDLDDLDFRHWSAPLSEAKVVDSRDFNGGVCRPATGDGHGHGTHVAGIATGTGEGLPAADDDGRYAGIAPGAQLAVGKVLTDAGAGVNSDLIAALEWASMPEEPLATGCAIGADIVNLSLGSEARPDRLNSGGDVDMVSLVLDRLAARYGTLFVAAAGNSGPYIGSALEAPGSAAQALSVAAAAKDHDVNHDDTLSGDTCAGWRHPRSGSVSDNDCSAGSGDQPPSIASFSSRGPSGDLWLRPDVAAPGYNIVSAQSATGSALAANDQNVTTRTDPLYATASGTSMAAPAAAGSAALVLDAYRQRHGGDPAGASGLSGRSAPSHALLRAALMNSAGPDLFEARWIFTSGVGGLLACPPELDPITFGLCDFVELIGSAVGSSTVYEVRNGAGDPYVGPLAEGAGKLNVGQAVAALRDGVVVYSAASGSGDAAGTGPRDLQGTWQIGAIAAGTAVTQRFVVHAAPGAGPATVGFAFDPGRPSDSSRSIPAAGVDAWTVGLPGAVTVSPGGDAVVELRATIPASAAPGTYTGAVLVSVAGVPGADGTPGAGQLLRVPVFASVALHDPDPAAGNAPGPQAALDSAVDVFAKSDTIWPSVAGQPGTGSNADWLVHPVDLAAGLSAATWTAWDPAGRDTYDLYLYDERLDLVASTHPFAAAGVSDPDAARGRPPSTAAAPAILSVRTPAGGRYHLVVSRAGVGRTGLQPAGDMGAYRLRLDEVRAVGQPGAAALAYEGDQVVAQGSPARLTARLTGADGAPIAGRSVAFTFDDPPVAPCPGGACVAVTDARGLAQLATDPLVLAPGIHEVRVAFAGDEFWTSASGAAFVLVVGTEPPPLSGSGRAQAAGWFVPDGAAGSGPRDRIHLALHATGGAAGATGQLRWRDPAAGLDLRLGAYSALVVDGRRATLLGTAVDADGRSLTFRLIVEDAGEPGKGVDAIDFRLLETGYARSGRLGGGNLKVTAG